MRSPVARFVEASSSRRKAPATSRAVTLRRPTRASGRVDSLDSAALNVGTNAGCTDSRLRSRASRPMRARRPRNTRRATGGHEPTRSHSRRCSTRCTAEGTMRNASSGSSRSGLRQIPSRPARNALRHSPLVSPPFHRCTCSVSRGAPGQEESRRMLAIPLTRARLPPTLAPPTEDRPTARFPPRPGGGASVLKKPRARAATSTRRGEFAPAPGSSRILLFPRLVQLRQPSALPAARAADAALRFQLIVENDVSPRETRPGERTCSRHSEGPVSLPCPEESTV